MERVKFIISILKFVTIRYNWKLCLDHKIVLKNYYFKMLKKKITKK